MQYNMLNDFIKDQLKRLRDRWEHEEYCRVYERWDEDKNILITIAMDHQKRFHLHRYLPIEERDELPYDTMTKTIGWEFSLDRYATTDTLEIIRWLENPKKIDK